MKTAIDPSKPRGFYYVGFVTQKSLDSMPSDEMRAQWPLNSAMSNIVPKRLAREAKRAAEAHHLRDVTIIKN